MASLCAEAGKCWTGCIDCRPQAVFRMKAGRFWASQGKDVCMILKSLKDLNELSWGVCWNLPIDLDFSLVKHESWFFCVPEMSRLAGAFNALLVNLDPPGRTHLDNMLSCYRFLQCIFVQGWSYGMCVNGVVGIRMVVPSTSTFLGASQFQSYVIFSGNLRNSCFASDETVCGGFAFGRSLYNPWR